MPVETRINDVRNFLKAIDNTLTYEVVPIQDAFGPTQSDPDMDVRIALLIFHMSLAKYKIFRLLLVDFNCERRNI